MLIPSHLEYAYSKIVDVPDFPQKGIVFKDITPLLEDEKAFSSVVDDLSQYLNGANKVAGIESRGFIFAAAIAARNNLGLVLLRKPGKLPRKTYSVEYLLEYGSDSLHLHTDSLSSKDQVLIVDDVLATGGTMKAAVELVGLSGAKISNCCVFLELSFLNGRDFLQEVSLKSSIII